MERRLRCALQRVVQIIRKRVEYVLDMVRVSKHAQQMGVQMWLRREEYVSDMGLGQKDVLSPDATNTPIGEGYAYLMEHL
jgi:hypothetical protein